MSNNPYSQANQAYTSVNKQKEGRDLEASVLLKSAQTLEGIVKRSLNGEKVRVQEYGLALENNQKIWTIFVDNMMNEENDIPTEIRNNVASLALFIFKHTNNILISKDLAKIQTLVEINRNIAVGLNKKVDTPKENTPKEQAYEANPAPVIKKPLEKSGNIDDKSGLNLDI